MHQPFTHPLTESFDNPPMSKMTTQIHTRKHNYTTLQAAFRSESGAIDLASIMVGIIVIGLIGGVIAATVFAVIPWSQDNAAKQQMESIHTAQNAFYGLSSDPAANLTGGVVNSFTDSAGLETAKLLTQNAATYCVIPATDGKDYKAYVKSASGKIYSAANSAKTPAIVEEGILTCVGTAGATTPAAETLPPASSTSPVLVKNYAFTSQEADFQSSGSSVVSSGPSIYAPSTNGTPSGSNFGTSVKVELFYSSTQPSGNLSANIPDLTVGKTYRVTTYLQKESGGSVRTRVNNVASTPITTNNYWTQGIVEFTVTDATNTVYLETGVMSTNGSTTFYIESVKIERIS